jgi:hypothetical protein
MPALFAYLIAVGLLLGGGYGALSWLAAPEPVKVVAKPRPKPPRYEAGPEATSPEARSADARSRAINARDRAASGSSEPSPSSQPPRWRTCRTRRRGLQGRSLICKPARPMLRSLRPTQNNKPSNRSMPGHGLCQATPKPQRPLLQSRPPRRRSGRISGKPAAMLKNPPIRARLH